VYVAGRDLGKLRANAGQFFVWRFFDGRGWTRGNPYSLSAVPSDSELRLTAKEVGDGSARLARLQPGTRVLIEGPYGRMHAGVRTRRQVLLVAAGIGITPMRSMLENLEVGPGELTVLYRARDDDDVVLAPEIDLLAAARGARVHYLLGPRRRSWRRSSWLPSGVGDVSDVEALNQLVPGAANHDVYICGPDDWSRGVRRTLLQAGVPPSHIHCELFTW
jgi:ferredoxin-NADP reductase